MVEGQIYYPRYIYHDGNVPGVTGTDYCSGYIYMVEQVTGAN